MTKKYDNNTKHHKNLIDPDLVSLLNVGLSGLAAISGLYQIYTINNKRNKEKEYNDIEYLAFRRNIREVKRSIYLFMSNIDSLEKFINRINRRIDKGLDFLSLPAIYGEANLYLYDFEVEIFIKYQESIFDSLRQYSINLTAMASFLSNNNEITSNESRLMIKSELEILVKNLNDIQKKEKTIGELLVRLKKISSYIHGIIQTIEEVYFVSDNYFD